QAECEELCVCVSIQAASARRRPQHELLQPTGISNPCARDVLLTVVEHLWQNAPSVRQYWPPSTWLHRCECPVTKIAHKFQIGN
ncbi:MAG: hypothetical protein ACKPKO_49925, partial [Candidatus Fonsibacter sp.]